MPPGASRHPLLASFQREAIKALAVLSKEITQREQELAALKAEVSRWQNVLRGPGRGVGLAGTPRGRLSKRRRLNWSVVLKELPVRFTPKDVAQKTGRPIAHAYTYVSRWMKDKKVQRVKNGYQKVFQAG